MALEFSCPKCERPLYVPAGQAGQKARCPGCLKVVAVPKRGRRPRERSRPGSLRADDLSASERVGLEAVANGLRLASTGAVLGLAGSVVAVLAVAVASPGRGGWSPLLGAGLAAGYVCSSLGALVNGLGLIRCVFVPPSTNTRGVAITNALCQSALLLALAASALMTLLQFVADFPLHRGPLTTLNALAGLVWLGLSLLGALFTLVFAGMLGSSLGRAGVGRAVLRYSIALPVSLVLGLFGLCGFGVGIEVGASAALGVAALYHGVTYINLLNVTRRAVRDTLQGVGPSSVERRDSDAGELPSV